LGDATSARGVKGTVLKAIVIVPTYNEAENIRLLVADILSLEVPIEVLVVDDNSPDGTGQIADDLAGCYSSVHAVHRAGKLGLGTAYIAGFKYGLAHDYERIMTMDADFSHHPSYIPAMLERSHTEADLVIGSRYVRGGGTHGCTLPRKLLSWGANAFAKTVLGLQALDCTAGFRCYRRQVLESIDLDAIVSNGYSFLIEMLYRCQRRGWHVSEVPILFENRRRGASKISKQEVLKAMQTVLRLGKERALSRGKQEAIVAGKSEVL
jgi:glycosyltransferase involved in cell wall biosynthesis